MKLFTPDVRKKRVTDIDVGLLEQLGVKGVIVDLDNTLGGYDDPLPPDDVVAWAAGIKDAGYALCIVSNNSHKERVRAYGEALGVPWKHMSAKPLTFKLRRAAKEMGLKGRDICNVGDKARTDLIGGRLAGMKTLLVTPVSKLKKQGE